jgi:drug/metabolite transporter (DMT)-like permease
MNWILLTGLMFLCSIILYVFVRLGKQANLSAGFLNFSNFAIPAILTFPFLIAQNISLAVPLNQLLILIFAGIVFSYLGNYLSMKGVQLAPNPGFSLMIQKSYGALTIFLAPLLFAAELTIVKVVGSILVIAFAFILSSEPGKKLFARTETWLVYTLGAFLSFACLSLTAKFLFLQGLNVYVYLFYLFTIVTVLSGVQLLLQRPQLPALKKVAPIFIGAGVFSFLFNIFLNLAIAAAPNVGYVNMANAGSIAALTVVAAWIFKDQLTRRKLLGVLGILVGLVLIFV